MGKIIKVSGPLVVAEGLADAGMADVVKVGKQGLKGEILTMTGDQASIQVYEETAGLGPGAEVVTTGAPLSVELGPGLLESIYDGIQRPLTEIRALAGETIARGIDVPALNRTKKWHFVPVVEAGCHISGGDIIGTVEETSAITHRIMVPHGVDGELESISEVTEKDASAQTFLVGTTEYAVPLGNLIDADAEIKKAKAEIERLTGFMTGIRKKLGNERFVQNAPAQVVEMERKKLADAESKIAALQESIRSLGA